MKKVLIALFTLLFTFSLAACSHNTDEAKKSAPSAEEETETQSVEQLEMEESDMSEEETMNTIRLFIGEEELPVRWEDNESVAGWSFGGRAAW